MNITANPHAAWAGLPADPAKYRQIENGLLVPAELADRLRRIDPDTVDRYERHLRNSGKAAATVQKYCRDIRSFAAFLGERYLSVGLVREWLEGQKRIRSVSTVNNAISALNGLFRWLDREDCRVSFFRFQEPQYRPDSRDLSLEDFGRLIDAADERTRTVALTLKGTGIRVSELRFFTVEAVKTGVVTVDNKGKTRPVFIDPGTRTVLLNYCEKRQIRSGVIFRNRLGGALSRCFIWRSLKKLALKAGVALSKVFPHNLRHLFAVERYRIDHDIESLRLDLGHTLLSTTQRYLKETVSARFERLMRQSAASVG